eukprot:SAG31_NODE_114_length_24318_cov_16.787481_7_plen_73_part_00
MDHGEFKFLNLVHVDSSTKFSTAVEPIVYSNIHVLPSTVQYDSTTAVVPVPGTQLSGVGVGFEPIRPLQLYY